MVRWLWLFVKIAVIVAVAVWLAERPGVIAVDWQGWRVETSVGIVVLAIALLLVTAVLLYRGWRRLRAAPGDVARWRRRKRQETGLQALSDGMIAVAAGDAASAHQLARKVANLDVAAPMKHLLDAQAAQLAGNEQAAARVFAEMLDHPESAFLGLRGLIAQALSAGDTDRALVLADKAYGLKPGVPWLVETLVALRSRAGDWRGAQLVLEDAVRRKTVTGDAAQRQLAALLMGRAEDGGDAELGPADTGASDTGASDAGGRQAKRALELDPMLIPAALAVARQAINNKSPRRARKIIEAAWAKAPHPDLLALYHDVAGGGDSMAQLKVAEQLVAANPKHGESGYALTEANLDAALWGPARSLLMPLLADAPTARHHRLTARLEEGDNHPDAVRHALDKAARAAADPAWVCDTCGAAADAWTPICGHCGELARLAWRPPRRVYQAASPDDAGPETALLTADPASGVPAVVAVPATEG